MTQYLPPNLLALFAPRDPMPYLPPTDKLPFEKNTPGYSGVGQFLKEFEDPKDTPPPTRVETKDERSERKRKERAEQVAYKLEQDLAMWDPSTNDTNIVGDPFKTLFVARINYDSSESKLRREFEAYGPIKRINLVTESGMGKPRGYAFIEYEHERDMHFSYKHGDGKKIDGRRVLVDVERGRTVKGWRPRRLGGGLGGTRRGGPDVNTKYSGREGREDGPNRDRSRSRERGGGDRRDRMDVDRKRRRSRSRERRRRSRSREGGEEEVRIKRGRRSRSRERGGGGGGGGRRSRSPRDRKRRRSREHRRGRAGEKLEPGVEEEGGAENGPGGEERGARVKEERVDARYEKAEDRPVPPAPPPPPAEGGQNGEEGEGAPQE